MRRAIGALSPLRRVAVARLPSAAAGASRWRSVDAAPPQYDVKEVWDQIWDEAAHHFKAQTWRSGDLQEFGVDRFLHTEVLGHRTLADGLAHSIGNKMQANLSDNCIDYVAIFQSAFKNDPTICEAVAADLNRFKVVDPATDSLLGIYLFFKGVQAVCSSRVSHHYWMYRGGAGRLIALQLQSATSDVYGVDIHPGVRLGRGITIDHATGVVIGETTVIGDNVYLMHDVTLGATGTAGEHDRHPKVGSNVFLGAKCTVLGNIEIGDGATVAAAALVNKPVPAGYTAVGVPAKLIAPERPMDVSKAK